MAILVRSERRSPGRIAEHGCFLPMAAVDSAAGALFREMIFADLHAVAQNSNDQLGGLYNLLVLTTTRVVYTYAAR